MYDDDMLTGDYSVEAAKDKMEQVSGALQNACMELRKWTSNSPSLLAEIPVEHRCSSTLLQKDTKTKVSPTKPLTIPRTELSGAVLAVKLVRWVLENNTWTDEPIPVFYWTDATIVLHWINGDPNRWKTFVASRVAYIRAHSNPHQWRHVSTNENPADLATRGRSPKELSTSSLWWNGPDWLSLNDNDWPTNSIPPIVDPSMLETKTDKINIHMLVKEDSILNRYSTFSRLIRITANILRFSINSRYKADRLNGHLKLRELNDALLCIVRLVQAESFTADLKAIHSSKPLPKLSKLRNLNPFIEDNVLRVRGRLNLVIKDAHHATLHGGVQLTLAHTPVHLEVVTGLTSDHFLWALDRFIGRRGLCRHIYSDNGTHFVGADKALRNELSRQRDNENTAAARLVDKQIE
ncbi:uncharacterized protein [Drosophila takahashii]|uniref:uncharacterized protein n=1 Tax=Drosophila takahashii TaxID=29030 RepID=UPI0038990B67